MGRSFKLLHVRGTLYANFGIGQRSLFEQLGYFDERFYMCGADPDFSLKVWRCGRRVVPAFGSLIDHDEHPDERRQADSARAAEDNTRFFAKWLLPPVNQQVNDFDPMNPCTLRGLSNAIGAAA
jgi:GT2 family glycosyltransferase